MTIIESFNLEKAAPKWNKFSQDITNGDKDEITRIQKNIGKTLSNNNDDRKITVILGDKYSGKTVFLNTIKRVLGSYYKNASINDILYDDISLKDKLFVRLDCDVADLSPSLVKSIIESKKMTANPKFQEPVTFNPKFKVWIDTNGITDFMNKNKDYFEVIVFNQTKDTLNFKLEEELTEELDAISQWCILGSIEL